MVVEWLERFEIRGIDHARRMKLVLWERQDKIGSWDFWMSGWWHRVQPHRTSVATVLQLCT
jgi:hypothetical protein